ncbi:MAG: aldehyde ferredoxin oxidoreductase C-terminal domain-containing protein [Desulfobacterales bacterium]
MDRGLRIPESLFESLGAQPHFTAKDDSLPRRLTEEPSPTGPANGMVCHLPEMLEEYYQVRGWTEDGLPGEEILNRFGLA